MFVKNTKSVIASLILPFVFAAAPAWGLTANEVAELLASDGADGDEFGFSVALSGDTVVVSAPYDDDSDIDAGSVYVFTHDSTGAWIEQAKLLASDGAMEDLFGYSVAVDGDTAVIGAPGHVYDNDKVAGAAYVFTRDSTGVWAEQAKLPASGAFGWAVAVDGDTAVISSVVEYDDYDTENFGAAYVFVRDSTGVWTEQAKLVGADEIGQVNFGFSVALDGDTALISATRFDIDDTFQAYVFTRDNTGVWTEQAKLVAADCMAVDIGRQGRVSLDGDTAVIGVPEDALNGTNSGAAYVFTRDSMGVWTEQAMLLTSDGAATSFGMSVAVDADTAVIRSAVECDDDGTNCGAAYVFTRDSMGVWTEQAKLLADGNPSLLGRSVALDGGTAVIGAAYDAVTDPGSAYVFHLEGVAEPLADLGISVTDVPDPVTRRSTVTYEANVTNYGPDAAEGATLTVQVPRGVKVTEPIQASQGVCEFELTSNAVGCDLGALPQGTIASVWIDAVPNRPIDITLTATAEAAQPADPNPDNNTAIEYTTVDR